MGHSNKIHLSSCNIVSEKTKMQCGIDFVSFKTKQQSDLWMKLHKKKCGICKKIDFSSADHTYTDVRI